jgi:hypothetical protein
MLLLIFSELPPGAVPGIYFDGSCKHGVAFRMVEFPFGYAQEAICA